MANGEGTVKSAERVASLLELLGTRKSPMRLRDIAQSLGIPMSSAHGLLQTMVAKGLVVRDDSQGYRLSLKLFVLAASALEVVDIREVARPAMERLSMKWKATCNLAILDGHDVLYIEKVEDRGSPVRLVTHVGTKLPAHVTSLGKVLVAALPRDEQEQWLSEHDFEPYTSRTTTDAASFARALRRVDKNGYAVDNQEFHEAITGLAAPVRDHTGATVAALSLTLLGLPLRRESLVAITDDVVAAAADISQLLRQPGAVG